MLSFKHCLNNNTAGGKGNSFQFLFAYQASNSCCISPWTDSRRKRGYKPLTMSASSEYRNASIAKSERNLDKDKNDSSHFFSLQMDVQAIPFMASSPQPEDCSHSHQPGKEKTKRISPKQHVLHKLEGELLRLYSIPAQQWFALQHCTLSNINELIFTKPLQGWQLSPFYRCRTEAQQRCEVFA